MEHLFVYGTLKDPMVQERVFGRVVEGKPDILAGFTKAQIALDDGVFPIIRPDPFGTVDGLVIEVTPGELALIDHYEGDAYARVQVILESRQRAWVYRAT